MTGNGWETTEIWPPQGGGEAEETAKEAQLKRRKLRWHTGSLLWRSNGGSKANYSHAKLSLKYMI